MVTLTCLYPAIRIHRAGCADIAREVAAGYARNGTNVEGTQDFTGSTPDETLTAIVTDLNDSFGWPYKDSDEPAPWSLAGLSIAPCVRDAARLVSTKPVPADRCPGSGQAFNTAGTRWHGGRPLYDACPVCGTYMGTGRGSVPAHKRRGA